MKVNRSCAGTQWINGSAASRETSFSSRRLRAGYEHEGRGDRVGCADPALTDEVEHIGERHPLDAVGLDGVLGCADVFGGLGVVGVVDGVGEDVLPWLRKNRTHRKVA
jgi:hypothetical protein